MATLFVSGSRSVRELPARAKRILDLAVSRRVSIVVGDCHGVDRLVQNYLKDYGNVVIYYIGDFPRWNEWSDPTMPIPGKHQANKDKRMAEDCTSALVVWDGKSRGSQANIRRLQAAKKPCYMVLA